LKKQKQKNKSTRKIDEREEKKRRKQMCEVKRKKFKRKLCNYLKDRKNKINN